MKQEELVKALKEMLLAATKNRHARAAVKAISELMDHGDSPSLNFTDDEQHYSPLMYACENGMIDTVRILLQSGASPGYTSKEKGSPRLNAFHVACNNGHLEIVQELLGTTTYSFQIVHPEADKTQKFGWTPVMYAIRSGHLEIVKLLGVDPNAVTKKGGQNVLHIAARGSEDKHLECLKWLCSQVDSESLLATDKNGWNLLHHACAGGNVAAVRWLVEQVKALPDAPLPSVKFLSQVTKSKSGYTPLHVACNYQNLQVLKFLLNTEGVDCQARTVKQGMTGLHFAALHDSAEMARLLIEKKCPLDIQDKEGNTALHIARVKCSFEVEEVLNAADSPNGVLSEIRNKDMKTAADIEPEVVIPPEIKKRGKEKEYIRALREGKERIPRCNLLILGEQEVGKTSLYRLITGRKFLSELESTKGIDNNIVEVVETRQLNIDSWNEIGEEERKTKDEEAYLSGVANEIGSLTATKAARPEQPPTEEQLLQWISDYVRDYKRSEDISSVQAKASSKRQSAAFFTQASSSHTPQDYRERSIKQEPEVSKQQPQARLTEPTHQQKRMKILRSSSPPPSLHAEDKHENDGEVIPPVSPVAVLEQHSYISRKRHLSIGKKLRTGCQKLSPELYLNTFDFAGQLEYRPMHHCFITSRAVYLVVFNLQKIVPLETEASEQSLEQIRYWLHSIHAHISQAYSKDKRIILVGTHCSPRDKKDGHPLSEDKLEEVHKKLYREFFTEDHHNRCVNLLCFVKGKERIFHAVENSCDKEDEREVSGAKLLQSELNRVTDNLDFLKSEYPIIWLRFEEQLLNLREKMQEQQLSQVVGYDEVLKLARKCGLSNRVGKSNEGEEVIPESVKTAIEFFHDTGTIVDLTLLPNLFIDDSEESQLKGLVLLDPKWLITVMRKVIELPHSSLKHFGEDLRDLNTKGIAKASLLKECWGSKEFSIGNDQQSFQQLCLILQAYGLIYPIEELKEDENETATATPPHRSASVPAKMSQATNVSCSPSVGDISLQPSDNSECFLVPCCLPEKADVKHLKGITFFFDFQGFLPAEIFHRLICLMLNKSRAVQRKRSVRHMFSSTCCYFPNVADCQWRVELDKKDCLKVTVRSRSRKCKPISYLSLFHLEYLKEICQGSGLHGIVYDGGPHCPCDDCGKVISVVVHDNDDIPSVLECDGCSTKVDVNCLLDPEYPPRHDEESTPQPSTTSQLSVSTSQQPTPLISANTVVISTGPANIHTSHQTQPSSSSTGADATSESMQIAIPLQQPTLENISSDLLGESDLGEVTEYLHTLDSSKCYNLGIQLGLTRSEVKEMKEDPHSFLDAVIEAWLQGKGKEASWGVLVSALKSGRLGCSDIATKIEEDKIIQQ